jgi:pimeloyl-ACP methyl ester carboxylesterase
MLKKVIMITTVVLITIFLLFGILLYSFQERMIFFPDKLPANHSFAHYPEAEEVFIEMKDGKKLHSLHFQKDQAKGVILYLHGNAGCLDGWGDVGQTYLALGYDVFVLDYRGFGKSEGKLNGQKLFFQDVQMVYDYLKTKYEESKITVLGYSIGTAAAAYLAANNRPKQLILQAPYYSLKDLMRKHYPLLPTFLLKYPFPTYKYLTACEMPVTIFHGDQDEVIYYGSALKLEKLFKSEDQLITLKGMGHNGMTENPDYRKAIAKLLD